MEIPAEDTKQWPMRPIPSVVREPGPVARIPPACVRENFSWDPLADRLMPSGNRSRSDDVVSVHRETPGIAPFEKLIFMEFTVQDTAGNQVRSLVRGGCRSRLMASSGRIAGRGVRNLRGIVAGMTEILSGILDEKQTPGHP